MLACNEEILVVAVPKLALACCHNVSAIVTVLPLIVAVIPFAGSNVNVPPPATLPVPEVPDKLIVVLTALEVKLVIRPLLSTTIVGMLVAEP